MKSNLLSLLLLIMVAGCAATFQTIDSNYDFGLPPTEYEEKIKEEMKYVLKDPESAMYDFRHARPVKAYTNSGLSAGGQVSWAGWVVSYRVNAKNSYGGYTGYETKLAFFSNNQIHRWKYPNSPYANLTYVR